MMEVNEGLEVNSVSHFYDQYQALDDVSLQVTAGSVHCLLGASGSGKSTLLRIIAGLERPVAGEIKVNGLTLYDEQINKLPEQRPVGLVFQQYALFPHLNVSKNIEYLDQVPDNLKEFHGHFVIFKLIIGLGLA